MAQPDEGLIHAWLDGELPPDEAARIEQMVATDPEWAAAVAEARGLMAASSRILSALDHVPADVIPITTRSAAPRRTPWWTRVAAAVVIVAGGSVLVLQRGGTPTPMATMGDTVASQPIAPTATSRPTDMPTPAAKAGALSRPNPPVVLKENEPTTQRAAARDAAASALATRTRSEESVRIPAPPPTVRDARKDASGVTGVAANVSAAEAVGGIAPQAAAAMKAEAPPAARPSALMRVANVADSAAAAGKRTVPTSANVALSQVVVTGASASAAPVDAACYRLVEDTKTDGAVLRVTKVDGDTLRLESGDAAKPLYAWLVGRDRRYVGVMSADQRYRGAVPVSGTLVGCPRR